MARNLSPWCSKLLTHSWEPCQAEPRSLTFIHTTKRNKTIQGVKWLHALQAKTPKKSNNMTPQGTYNKEKGETTCIKRKKLTSLQRVGGREVRLKERQQEI